MINSNLPWKHAHLKYLVGYRRWEAIKHFKNRIRRQRLLAAFNSGKKILFIHIPKTAGVSLIGAYEDYYADARHSPALVYKLLLGKEYGQFSTFSIVRNPWARVFSAYTFLMKGGLSGTDPEMGQILKEQSPTFEQFVKEWLPKNGVCSYGHFVPQHEFVCGWGNDVIVNHIIKLENLDKDWPDLADALNIPLRKIQHVNASTKDDYRNYYDNESIEVVRKLYKKDIELFKYTYD